MTQAEKDRLISIKCSTCSAFMDSNKTCYLGRNKDTCPSLKNFIKELKSF